MTGKNMSEIQLSLCILVTDLLRAVHSIGDQYQKLMS